MFTDLIEWIPCEMKSLLYSWCWYHVFIILIYLFQYIKNNHNNFLKKQGPKSLTLYILVATPLKKAVISGGLISKPNTCVIKSLKCYDWILIFILVVQSSEVWSILI